MSPSRLLKLFFSIILVHLALTVDATCETRPTLQYTGTYPTSLMPSVKVVQQKLNSMNNAGLVVDGQYGPSTKNAVVAYQTKKNLYPYDGIVGPITWASLCDAVTPGNGLKDLKLAWSAQSGGLALSYTVGGTLSSDVPIALYWASGTDASKRIGNAFFTNIVRSGTPPGTYSIAVKVPLLADSKWVTHILATATNVKTFAIADVVVETTSVDVSKVTNKMFYIVKDGLRAAGQPRGVITSTIRSPKDQARVMFDNLVKPGGIQAQNGIYGAPGKAVIKVYETKVKGLTSAQIMQSRVQIEAAMLQKINEVGPSNVSKHCGDPTKLCVIDVGASTLGGSPGDRFKQSVQPRLTKFLDERNVNGCYHLELAI